MIVTELIETQLIAVIDGSRIIEDTYERSTPCDQPEQPSSYDCLSERALLISPAVSTTTFISDASKPDRLWRWQHRRLAKSTASAYSGL
jgi:hypothetical protein